MKTQTITLRIEKDKYKSFLEIIRMLDYVQIESPEKLLNEYVKADLPATAVSDQEIQDEVYKARYNKKKRY